MALQARRLEVPAPCRGTLADRGGWPSEITTDFLVSSAAALNWLNIAVEQWTATDGHLNLSSLLDATFAALASGTTRHPGASRTAYSNRYRASPGQPTVSLRERNS